MTVAAEKPGTDLVPAEHSAVTLFRTEKPDEVVARAAETANAVSAVIAKKKLFATIGGHKHVLVDGWTLTGAILGVFPVCVWTRKLDNGWEARVEARTKDGSIVGAAEAMCVRAERTWAKRDDYALRSMAQTRATSKALRQPLGFVISMAGFSATPAEEMSGVVIEDAEVSDLPDALQPDPSAPCSDAQAKNIWRLISKLDKAGTVTKDKSLETIGSSYGTENPAELYKHQAHELINRLKKAAGEDE